MTWRLSFIFLLFSFSLSAQVYFLPLGNAYRTSVLNAVNHSDTTFIHTGWQPLNISSLNGVQDSSFVFTLRQQKDTLHNGLLRHLKYENLLLYHEKGFTLRMDLLMKFEGGRETETIRYNPFINTRGIIFRGDIAKHFSFESRFYENQAFYPEYVRKAIGQTYVAPGQGRVRGFKSYGFDFSSAAGWLSYKPWQWLNFQFGNGKNFIGEGYRSLLLSDNPFTYPFAKITVSHGRFQYTSMFTSFVGVRSYDNISIVHQKQHGSYHYLNTFLTSRWQVGLFEGIIWHTATADYHNYDFPPTYFVPIIFLNTAIYGLSSKHKALLGLNSSYKISKTFRVYGQLAVDAPDSSTQKQWGYQLGGYCFNPLGIKNLLLQAEYNYTEEGLYQPVSVPVSLAERPGWYYYGQPLAHPQGSGFAEWLVRGRYVLHDFFVDFHYDVSKAVADNTLLTYQAASVGYIINHATNLQLYIGTSRRTTTSPTYDGLFIFGGLKTNLNNYYYDF